MTLNLHALAFDANDPARLARFWGGVLRQETVDLDDGGIALLPSEGPGIRIEFYPTQVSKVALNQIHFT